MGVKLTNRDYDKGFLEGSQAQNEADHKHIIKPLKKQIKQLERKLKKCVCPHCGFGFEQALPKPKVKRFPTYEDDRNSALESEVK